QSLLSMLPVRSSLFTGPSTTWTYTLSLHDALPICFLAVLMAGVDVVLRLFAPGFTGETLELARRLALILLPGILFMGMNGWLQADRKSTRLNSSHVKISYAVFCLKKKKLEIASLS